MVEDSEFDLDVFEVNAQLKELEPTHLEEILLHHLGKTAEILIFLLGAMTIVEIIDYFNGFVTIKNFQELQEKDYVAICDVGAYGMSLSSNYNLRTKPLELLIKNNKNAYFLNVKLQSSNFLH